MRGPASMADGGSSRCTLMMRTHRGTLAFADASSLAACPSVYGSYSPRLYISSSGVPSRTSVGYTLSMSGRRAGSSHSLAKSSSSLRGVAPGRPGIIWAHTLYPASLAALNASTTSASVWPLLAARYAPSRSDCTPISTRVAPSLSISSTCSSRQ